MKVFCNQTFKILLQVFCVAFVLNFSCSKKESTQSPPSSPPPVIGDTSLRINTVTKIDLNVYDLGYQVKPPQGEYFSNVFLHWSTSPDFIADHDSSLISNGISSSTLATYHFPGLKQASRYYSKLSAINRNKIYYSSVAQWNVDSLKILDAFGLDTFPMHVNRSPTLTPAIFTNLNSHPAITTNPPAKIFIGSYECPVTEDDGNVIFIHVPLSIPPGKYKLRLDVNGMSTLKLDSVYVMKCLWSDITPPVIPLCGCGYNQNGVGEFGSCHSSQKGYMLGGFYYHGLQIPNNGIFNGWPGDIWEFDGPSETWLKRTPLVPKIFMRPICYYYNNSIYVIAGEAADSLHNNLHMIRNMLKFDLGTMTWSELDPLPYPAIFNLVSFEMNNEWYIGMGYDSANRSVCCGEALPSNKFWKYNPATNVWTQLANFPGGDQNFPTGFSIGSKGYVFYGAIPIGNPNGTLDYRQEFWEYNPSTNSWSQLSLPQTGGPPIGEKYQIISYNNKGYFLTGQYRTVGVSGYYYNLTIPHLEYDPLTGSFQKVSNASDAGIMKLILQSGNKFYFQSDAYGYYYSVPNVTNKFVVE